MFKNVFALASVSAITAFVAVIGASGCSSSEPAANGSDPKPSEQPPGSTTPSQPSQPSQSAAQGDGGAAPTCMATQKFTADESHPTAPMTTSSCTKAAIGALADACMNDPYAQGCTDVRAADGNKACADCVFGNKEDDTWKVITLMPNDTPKSRYNQAGCIDNVTGVPGCGKAYFAAVKCLASQCGTCQQNDVGTCVDSAKTGECKDYLINDKACTSALQSKGDDVTLCFPPTDDAAGVRTMFVTMATLACGGGS